MSDSIGQIAVRTIRCPKCLKWPGEQCVTKTGRQAGYAHADRCAPVLAAWNQGYEAGEKYAASIVRALREVAQREESR